MENKETPAEYKDKFMLSFVEMGWADPSMVDPRFKNWTGGRMEIPDYETPRFSIPACARLRQAGFPPWGQNVRIRPDEKIIPKNRYHMDNDFLEWLRRSL